MQPQRGQIPSSLQELDTGCSGRLRVRIRQGLVTEANHDETSSVSAWRHRREKMFTVHTDYVNIHVS